METDLFLAGALAFLIAMLGWSDQIRGTQEKTRLLEKELLTKYQFDWAVLRPLIRPDDSDGPAQRLRAVIRLLGAGALQHGDEVKLLRELEAANETRERMEAQYSFRFWLVYATCAEMFVAGFVAEYANSNIVFPVPQPFFWVISSWNYVRCDAQWVDLLSVVWAIFIIAMLMSTFLINRDENRLRKIISNVDDLLRQSRQIAREKTKATGTGSGIRRKLAKLRRR